MKKVCLVVLSLLMWSGSAFAACVATITASTPTTDFTVNGNGTVTHSKTGLMWKQCSEGQGGIGCAGGAASTHTWQQALQLVATLNNNGVGFAGFTDWRVPNIKELNSIVENQCFALSINMTIFPATVGLGYWSASPYAGSATFAWTVNLFDGYDVVELKSANGYVRLVRGGQ